MTRLLENISQPSDLRRLSSRQMETLAVEIRDELLHTVLQTGGHLASNLGAVELTLALHRSFTTPTDKIVWDVGHQCYVHKLLTGRRERFATIRQYGGLSGFPDRAESEHDCFGAGHASTAVSAALGIAAARDLAGDNFHVVAVVGDGAMSGGLAFEGVNNAGHLGTRLILVLNDNGMSIASNVGALAKYLGRIRTDPRYARAKAGVEQVLVRLPLGMRVLNALKRFKQSFKGLVMPTLLWEELGFTYLGPINGHDLPALEEAFARAKRVQRPVLLHVYTTKGKGYDPAEEDAVSFHGVAPNGKKSAKGPGYSKVFGTTMVKLAAEDEKIVAITAAMPDGTGLRPFAQAYPRRLFDVGIAEEHAVTFAAGLASQGFRPVVTLYSTFLQRTYDQIVHDVCLQKLPVVFAIDRAGLVGDDGRTHHGVFDISLLRHVPEMVLMSPKDENELQHMLYTALRLGRPVALRYPRGHGTGTPLDTTLQELPVGQAEVLRKGEQLGLVAYGPMVQTALAAAEVLAQEGIEATVVNLRFAKPLDETLLVQLAQQLPLLVTIEENVLQGGVGSAILEVLETHRPFAAKIRRLGIADRFVEHGNAEILRRQCDLAVQGVLETIARELPQLRRQPLGTQSGRRLP
ncbi:MAG: 1-deoxy-D-xylulose-5-phosphate synthase [Chloroflexota bacterium]